MNNLFLLLFYISFLCIPIFIIWAIINLFRRKPAKKRFASAGISALALVISTVGFGLTMDDTSSAESVNMVSEIPDVVEESPTLQPTIAPTAAPTIRPTSTPAPTKIPTPEPTDSLTPLPTNSPTPQPTATPTLQPTEKPQPTPSPIEAQEPQAEKAPESQIIADPATPSTAISESQPAVASSVQEPESTSVENSGNSDTTSQNAEGPLVWIDDTAKRYHRKNGCGMDNAYQVTLDEAIQKGKTPCGRCYK